MLFLPPSLALFVTCWILIPQGLAIAAGLYPGDWSARSILNRLLAAIAGALAGYGTSFAMLDFLDRTADAPTLPLLWLILIAAPILGAVVGFSAARRVYRWLAARSQNKNAPT